MHVAHRSFAATGVALMGAGIIAATPAIAPMTPAIPQLTAPQIALQASVLDIFTFPAIRQAIRTDIEYIAIGIGGLVDAGRGVVQTAAALPDTVSSIVGDILQGNLTEALTTATNALTDAAQAIFVPPIAASIRIAQIQLILQANMQAAVPLAFVDVGRGFVEAFGAIADAAIVAGQNLIQAIGSFDLGNIATALVDGIAGVAQGVLAGGGAIVDGIVSAQNRIATALTPPPAAATSSASVAVPKAAAATLNTRPSALETAAPEGPSADLTPSSASKRAAPARVHRNAVAVAPQIDSAPSDGPADDAPAKAAASRRASR